MQKEVHHAFGFFYYNDVNSSVKVKMAMIIEFCEVSTRTVVHLKQDSKFLFAT